jgi:hypothetical protein
MLIMHVKLQHVLKKMVMHTAKKLLSSVTTRRLVLLILVILFLVVSSNIPLEMFALSDAIATTMKTARLMNKEKT